MSSIRRELDIGPGEKLGLVGEIGIGQVEERPLHHAADRTSSGEVWFQGFADCSADERTAMRALRRDIAT